MKTFAIDYPSGDYVAWSEVYREIGVASGLDRKHFLRRENFSDPYNLILLHFASGGGGYCDFLMENKFLGVERELVLVLNKIRHAVDYEVRAGKLRARDRRQQNLLQPIFFEPALKISRSTEIERGPLIEFLKIFSVIETPGIPSDLDVHIRNPDQTGPCSFRDVLERLPVNMRREPGRRPPALIGRRPSPISIAALIHGLVQGGVICSPKAVIEGARFLGPERLLEFNLELKGGDFLSSARINSSFTEKSVRGHLSRLYGKGAVNT